MARKKLTEYFPPNDPPKGIHCHIRASLRDKTALELKKRNLTWSNLTEAACELFLHEVSSPAGVSGINQAATKAKARMYGKP